MLSYTRVFIKYVICISTIFVIAPVSGNNNILTLDLAVSTSIKNNKSLKSLQSNYQASLHMPSQAGSLADPMLMLGAMNVPTDSFNFSQEGMTQQQIGISQSFPFPGKLSLKKSSSEHMVKSLKHRVEEKKQQIVASVKKSWWQLFFLNKSIDVIDANKSLFEQLVEVAQKKYEVGRGLQQDVLLAQLELSKLIDKKINLTSKQNQEFLKLKNLMGVPLANKYQIPKEINKDIDNLGGSTHLIKKAKKLRALLGAKNEMMLSANEELKLAKKGYLPDFKLSVFYGKRRGDDPAMMGGGPRSDFLSAQLGITLPIYAGSKQKSKIEEQQYILEASRSDLLDTTNEVETNILVSIDEYRKYQKQYSLYESGILPQSKQTVESMMSGYQVNKVDFLSLIKSQITALNYELEYWRAFTNLKKVKAKLVALVGTGEDE